MISYLVYTTICMGLVLLFYHTVLAKEKMYQTNRWYLLIGLSFSLIVPFLPLGVADFSFSLVSESKQMIINEGISGTIDEPGLLPSNRFEFTSQENSSLFDKGISILFYLYGIIALSLIMRLGWQFYQMRKKALKNPASMVEGYKIVLLAERIVPYTFGKTIFVNKQQFDRGEISEEMILHELTHAKEHHTLDVLFIEILKAVFWFNPVLYYYKRAIQMNHEFIADQIVLSRQSDITHYQNILLSLSKRKLAGSLSTNLNYNVTKKRIMMMTSSTSTCRYILKSALILPFFAILGLTFGCEPASMERNSHSEKIDIEILSNETIKLNAKTISVSQFASAFRNLSKDPDKTLINMMVHENASMGTVTDVHKVLREQGTFKINHSKKSARKYHPEAKKTPTVKERNILKLYINDEGQILADQDPIPLSSVKKLVKVFITNNGDAVNLSETPRSAIISFKTDEKTPQDKFTNTLEEVIAVYEELRNQESIKLFGKPYSELEDGSDQQNKIIDLYPKRISIEETSG